MVKTQYRIIDVDCCGQILANGIPTFEQAQSLLELLRKDLPNCELEIESYTVNIQD